MKRIAIVLGGLLVLGGVLAASLKAGGGKKGVRVYAEAAARRDLQQVVKATGEINPRVKVNISAHVVAKIEQLFINEGDWIEKGKPFLRLEQNVFVADRDQWAAQLRSAETAVRQKQVALADAASKLHRAERLYAGGSFAAEQLENAQLAERSARLQVEEARDLVSQDRANLARAETDLRKTIIYAPISGQVIALNAKEGEVVVSGTMNNAASVIGTIADMSEVLAEVDVDETEIVQVRLGQHGTLKVDALPKHVYHGRVTEVGSSGYGRPSQPDVTFFKVKLLLDDGDRQLRSGMSVRAEIATQTDKAALVVPIQAVVERRPLAAAGGRGHGEDAGIAEEVKVVFVVASGKARQRQVGTGISDETHVEVTAGLQPGERVVTGPYRSLRDLKDGDPVRIVAPAPGGGGEDQDKQPGGGDGEPANGKGSS
ncbi:MAG TPA: efflux RND transporter periplasmic adaptor subunit [Thermoanaerobaculia bacterium]|nr:efflux RND transporter periplasmic adaptor subunit [Thermoanaerobaculia bacterium]